MSRRSDPATEVNPDHNDLDDEDAGGADSGYEGLDSGETPRYVESPPARPLAARIGDVVQAARVRRGLTQAALAQLAGISQGALSKLERGTGAATTGTIERVLAAIGLQLHVEAAPVDADLDRGGGRR